MRPYPSKVGQSEKQQVLFTGNHYVFSVYKSKTQTTTVSLSSSVIESFSKLKPTSQSDSTITYGPFSSVEPLKQDAMKIHFENNAPFLTVRKIDNFCFRVVLRWVGNWNRYHTATMHTKKNNHEMPVIWHKPSKKKHGAWGFVFLLQFCFWFESRHRLFGVSLKMGMQFFCKHCCSLTWQAINLDLV